MGKEELSRKIAENILQNLRDVKIKPNVNSNWYDGEYIDSKDADATDALDLFGENKHPKDDL